MTTETKTEKEFVAKLKILGACSEGLKFVSQFETWQKAWDSIERQDWLFWVIKKKYTFEQHSLVAKLAKDLAELAKKYADAAAANAADADAADYADAAFAAACAAAANAADAAAADAAAADAAAAHASYAAAHASYAAAHASYAAADAADASYAAAENKKEICNLIRSYYPIAPEL